MQAYNVAKKVNNFYFYYNFDKYRPLFIIFSLAKFRNKLQKKAGIIIYIYIKCQEPKHKNTTKYTGAATTKLLKIRLANAELSCCHRTARTTSHL